MAELTPIQWCEWEERYGMVLIQLLVKVFTIFIWCQHKIGLIVVLYSVEGEEAYQRHHLKLGTDLPPHCLTLWVLMS